MDGEDCVLFNGSGSIAKKTANDSFRLPVILTFPTRPSVKLPFQLMADWIPLQWVSMNWFNAPLDWFDKDAVVISIGMFCCTLIKILFF